VSHDRYKSIPLPAAVLALSVAVCIGASGAADCQSLRFDQRAQAQQRETIEQLIGVIQQAARKLTDRFETHAAHGQLGPIWQASTQSAPVDLFADATTPAVRPLRDALLNLPPPAL